MPTTAYVNGTAVSTPPYEGSVIDVADAAALSAELVLRARQAGAAEQQVADERALSALASAKGDIAGLQQRVALLRSDLDAIAQLHAEASDAASTAREDASAALAAAQAVPAADVASVARLAADVQDYGLRTVNQAAAAQATIAADVERTLAQVAALQAEVEQLTGTATATVDGIAAAATAAVEQAQADVAQLLASTPGDVAAAVQARLGQVEVLVGGTVDPKNKFQWLWEFATLADPATTTRTVPMPILPGWEGRPGRSGAPVAGGGAGGSGAASLVVTATTTPSTEQELVLRNPSNTSLPGRPWKGPAGSLLFHLREVAPGIKWCSGRVDLAAALSAGDESFTVSAELIGTDGAPDYAFRVARDASGNTHVYVTTATACELRGTPQDVPDAV